MIIELREILLKGEMKDRNITSRKEGILHCLEESIFYYTGSPGSILSLMDLIFEGRKEGLTDGELKKYMSHITIEDVHYMKQEYGFLELWRDDDPEYFDQVEAFMDEGGSCRTVEELQPHVRGKLHYFRHKPHDYLIHRGPHPWEIHNKT